MRTHQTSSLFMRLLSAGVLLLGTLAWIGCDSSDSGMEEAPVPDQLSYDLTAQSNDGAAPNGVSGSVTF